VCDLLQVTVSGTFLAVAQTVSGGSVNPLLTIQNAPGTQFWVAGELFVLFTGGSASTSTSLYLARVGATSVAVSATVVFPNGLGVGEEIFVWAYGNAWTVTFQVRCLAGALVWARPRLTCGFETNCVRFHAFHDEVIARVHDCCGIRRGPTTLGPSRCWWPRRRPCLGNRCP
jgi:hypothetical protein